MPTSNLIDIFFKESLVLRSLCNEKCDTAEKERSIIVSVMIPPTRTPILRIDKRVKDATFLFIVFTVLVS